MQLLTLFALILISTIMLIQDLKYRAITWMLFPVFFAVLLFWNWQNLFFWLQSLTINLLFITLNLVLVMSWFALKGISPKQLIKQYLGVGDLLLFLVLALSLPFYLFLPFQIISLILAMLLGLSVFKDKTVPLAGIQSAFLVLILGSIKLLEIPVWKLEYLLR